MCNFLARHVLPVTLGLRSERFFLQVLEFLDVKEPDVDKLAMFFTSILSIKSVWDEINELLRLYNTEAPER